MSQPFDEQALLDRVDGDVEFLEETIEMLEDDVPPLLEQLGQATASRNAEVLVTSAHAIKGMLANFCAEPAEAAARELEMMGREERLVDVAMPADRVQRETEQLQAALHEFLKAKTE